MKKEHSIFQAHCQWIFSSQNKIEKKDKPALFQKLRLNQDFDKELEKMSSNPTYLKYPHYSKHMNEKFYQGKMNGR